MIYVDLDTQSMYDGKKPLIQNGKPIGDYKLPDDKISFSTIENLYQIYKHSVPNMVKYKKTYFKVESEKESSINFLINGANRQNAKEKLESTLLIGILNHSLIWPDNKKWFWQSNQDKDLVLLRKWFILQT